VENKDEEKNEDKETASKEQIPYQLWLNLWQGEEIRWIPRNLRTYLVSCARKFGPEEPDLAAKAFELYTKRLEKELPRTQVDSSHQLEIQRRTGNKGKGKQSLSTPSLSQRPTAARKKRKTAPLRKALKSPEKRPSGPEEEKLSNNDSEFVLKKVKSFFFNREPSSGENSQGTQEPGR
jgi:hypothetical protein